PEDSCKGDLVERSTRRGKPFYSCSKYPECEHSIWYRPVNVECESCGFPYMMEKSTKAKGEHLACPKCNHIGVQEAKKEASVN
ncbi:MAG: topoisomerase DNA-binding C4 zinc finger domain-containing protein, partial [candidate division Zixibacteria bacterium]